MKKLLFLLLYMALTIPSNQVFAQCSVISTDGYTVTFVITQNNLILTPTGPTCNFQVILDYNIVYSGINIQPLYFVNGSSDCIPDPDLFLPMPTTGFGTTTSAIATYPGLCSNLTLNCINNLTLAGSGIPQQTLVGCGVIIYPLVLPVELISFTGQHAGNDILLEWATASETSNKGFVIERSLSGNDWETIGWINGAGTSTQNHQYSFRHTNPKYGVNYLRLKQEDMDGKYEYSNIISIYMSGEQDDSISVYPNPVSNILSIQVNNNQQVNEVLIFNQFGQKILSAPYDETLDVSSLPRGIYVVVLQMENRNITQRILVQ